MVQECIKIVLTAQATSDCILEFVLSALMCCLLVLVLSGQPQASTVVSFALSPPPVLNLVSAMVRRPFHNLNVPHDNALWGARHLDSELELGSSRQV